MIYGDDLARIHHAHFGELAREAAGHLVELLRERGFRAGAVVELACGSGISSRTLLDDGYDVHGVDVSEPMLELARRHAPRGRFVRASLWDSELTEAIAVTAIGEAFCYQLPELRPDHAILATRLHEIADALVSGGVLLFDVATPGRSGPSGHRQVAWEVEGARVELDEREDRASGTLTRTLDIEIGNEVRRERHRLSLFDPGAVEASLRDAGLVGQRVSAWGACKLRPGWTGFVAIKS